MSVDLRIYPLRRPEELNDTYLFLGDCLSFEQDYRIFGQLNEYLRDNDCDDVSVDSVIKATEIPPQMWVEHYSEEGIERTREDGYGTVLTFVYAQQLEKLKVPDDASPKNKAIKAFIDALPNDTPIILWWW